MKKEIIKIRTDVYGIENKQYKESIKMKFFEKTGQMDWLLIMIIGGQKKKWEDTNIGNKKGLIATERTNRDLDIIRINPE